MQGGIRQIFSVVDAGGDDSQYSFLMPVGSWEGLLLSYVGTNDTGETLAASDLGSIEINDGRPLQLARLADYDTIGLLKRGTLERVSTISSTIDFMIYVPLVWYDDTDSVFEVANNENVRVTVTPASTQTTRLGANSLTLKVYGIQKTGLMPYRMKVTRFDMAIVNGIAEETLQPENIGAVYVEDTSNITRIRYLQDGIQVVETDRNSLQSLTTLDNKVEGTFAAAAVSELDFTRRKDLTKVLNDSNIIQVDGSGADTLTLTIFSFDFTPAELAATIAKDAAVSQGQVDAKRRQGKSRAVQVVTGGR